MDAYKMFEATEPFQNMVYRSIMGELMYRSAVMMRDGINDIPSKIKTELMLHGCIFGTPDTGSKIFIEDAARDYERLNSTEQKNIDIVLRDITQSFKEDILNADVSDRPNCMIKVLDSYVEFKKNIDNVSPEAAAEVNRMVNMTDEEFEEEMAKEDNNSYPDPPNTESYNPDYDIPDEKLYSEE